MIVYGQTQEYPGTAASHSFSNGSVSCRLTLANLSETNSSRKGDCDSPITSEGSRQLFFSNANVQEKLVFDFFSFSQPSSFLSPLLDSKSSFIQLSEVTMASAAPTMTF